MVSPGVGFHTVLDLQPTLSRSILKKFRRTLHKENMPSTTQNERRESWHVAHLTWPLPLASHKETQMVHRATKERGDLDDLLLSRSMNSRGPQNVNLEEMEKKTPPYKIVTIKDTNRNSRSSLEADSKIGGSPGYTRSSRRTLGRPHHDPHMEWRPICREGSYELRSDGSTKEDVDATSHPPRPEMIVEPGRLILARSEYIANGRGKETCI